MLTPEHLRVGFIKWHLNRDGEEGWPWRPILHQITTSERMAHSHPGNFTSTIVRGDGYVEEIYSERQDGRLYLMAVVRRRLGERFETLGETIHRIIALPSGECWTLVEHEPNRREVRLYDVGDLP